eukprot:Transcript_18521.p1 GENE.Transcript_18521~~Transcript_18521.p1  ORF type:complete len:264 (+),score=62.77 Transcript_18521:1074-1865(+)
MLLLLLLQQPSWQASSSFRPAVSGSRAAVRQASMLAQDAGAGPPAGPKPAVYFVMGGPGSGKGTQCSRLVESHGMVHLSAGDLLRAEVASGSAEGQKIADVIKEGKIVVSETTVGLLRKAMSRSEGPFLIDGFPRSLSNLHAFEAIVGPCEFMLFLEARRRRARPSSHAPAPSLFTGAPVCTQVSEAEMEARLIKRGASSGRSDDNAETIRKRFRTFVDESMPVIEELERRGVVHRVSAEASADDVYDRVCDTLEQNPLPSAA